MGAYPAEIIIIMMESQLCLLAFLLWPLPTVHSSIWAWMYSLPQGANEVPPRRDSGLSSSQELTVALCSHGINCPQGFFCDHHFGLCLPFRQEGEFCRQDAHCATGLSCMFGKCQQAVSGGQEGARCHHDKDCAPDTCCARQHGEMVCKNRLLLDEGCYIPEGGIAFSVNQVCPCLKGLVCKKILPNREVSFEYWSDKSDWRCQKK
ncbi:dickkopf-related protein 3-like [Rhineura floridana]|uniref:dickkopf-related protein 3-like n=1 Tax=Rhineura floridana TaxID=261503 RepID=UPI002AC82FF5|nr:dickkopf-related protein 3-like [Rhineura floridana]